MMDASGTMIYSHYLVRPYHYDWPFWYWCQRKLWADIDVAEDYYISPSWQRIIGSYTEFGTTAYKLEGDVGAYWVSAPNTVSHNYHFGGYYFWADSDDTGDVGLLCHGELF
jgi:hypothetical protein